MNDLPFRAVPPPPAEYTVSSVLGRYADGLGFRYHWATEGLTEQDLQYRPDDSGRSMHETLGHIYNIVTMVRYAFTGKTFELPEQDPGLEFAELRRATLECIQQVSDHLKECSGRDLETRLARFRIGGKEHAFPFWNSINGTMSDALYHVGQVVAFRRSAGNPIDPAVNVFLGARPEARGS
jgi:uncharacterized damage-inducible protein DinB